jgi:hypothetical protein
MRLAFLFAAMLPTLGMSFLKVTFILCVQGNPGSFFQQHSDTKHL